MNNAIRILKMLIRSSKGLFKKAHESVNTFSSRIVTLLVVGTFSLFFFSLCFYSSQQKSITNDEVAHISGGYMIWRTGDFRINVEHPPLVKLFATLPLLDLDLYAPVEDYDWREALEWHFGRGFLFFYNDADSIALFSRCSIMILGFILGWVVYYWGRRLFNTTGKSYSFFAGVFAATLYFTEPNLIAHSSLVTYDMAFALVTVCTGYFYWALLVRGITLRRIVGFVVCIVVAPLVKVIGILLWFLIFVHLGCICLFGKRKWKVYRKKSLVKTISTVREKISYSMALFLVCAAFCYFAIWASYGFRYEISPGTEKPSAEQIKRYLNSSRFASPVLGHIFRVVQQNRLLPQGYEAVIGHAFMEQTRASFLWGTSNYEGGFYSYFLVTTLLKTPLAHLACFMIAVVILIVQTVALRFPDRKKSFNRAMFYFHRAAIPVYLIVGFFVVLSLSRLNIGHRHILMIIPLECMVAGCCFGLLMPRLRPFWRGVSATVFLVILLLPLRLSYPHYISYFNPLIGWRGNAGKFLLDSNVDWGQDFKLLGKYVKTHNIEKLNLYVFGTADPYYYGVRKGIDLGSFQILPPYFEHGLPDYTLPTAVSVNMIRSVIEDYPELLRTGPSNIPPDLIGGSIFIFPPFIDESK